MCSQVTGENINETISKIVLKKQRFEEFYNLYVQGFQSSYAPRDFQNFRRFYHNKIRDVYLFNLRK